MRYFSKNIKGIAACLILGVALQVNAQGNSSAAAELLSMKHLWLNSQNAAGMVFDDITNYSNLQINYDRQSGNYHRPQEGEIHTDMSVSSEGFMNLNNAIVWGSFNFIHRDVKDAGFNASITDPFRGMPYYVADENISNWRNQYYDLRFRASTPLVGGRWTFGLEGVYQASLAAKQRDPRVDTRYYTLKLVPGVAYQFSENHKLGASLRYESIKEDARMENKNTDINQPYYSLYGLGVAVQGYGHGYDTNYYGDRWGGALQYNYANHVWNLLLEVAYDVHAENVERSFTSPKKDAGIKDKTTHLSLTAYRQGKEFSHYLNMAYLNRRIDGIQYVSQYDKTDSFNGWEVLYKSIRSTYDTNRASLNYQLIKNRGTEYSWKVEAGVDYLRQEDEYLLPHSVKNYENLILSLCGKKNFRLTDKMNRRLLVDMHAAYNNNLSGENIYGGSHADYLTVTQLETGDINYLTSDYWRLGASLTYSQQVKAGQKTNFFAKAAFSRVTTSDYTFDGRTALSVSFGCNF